MKCHVLVVQDNAVFKDNSNHWPITVYNVQYHSYCIKIYGTIHIWLTEVKASVGFLVSGWETMYVARQVNMYGVRKYSSNQWDGRKVAQIT